MQDKTKARRYDQPLPVREAAMKVADVDVKKLHEDPKNARRHPDNNLAAITDSLKRFGAQKPVVARPDGTVVAGNGTLRAAIKLGWKKVPVVYTRLPDGEAAAYGLADNQTALLAEWDDEALAALLRDLKGNDVTLEGLGWESAELDDLVGVESSVGLMDPDDIPAQPPSVTKPGDVWTCGEHTVVCGDARERHAYPAKSPALVIADPPYAVGIGKKNADLNAIGRSNRVDTPMAGDQGTADQAAEALWGPALKTIHAMVADGVSLYWFAPQGGDQMMMMMMMIKANFHPSMHQLIWRKNSPTFSMGRIDYQYSHEPILFTWKGTGHRFFGESQTSVIDCDRPSRSESHPTMKPTALITRFIENSSKRGETVLDPFLGSGTTLIACEQTGRICHGIEIDSHYVDVSINRWEQFTGKKAVRIDRGSSVAPEAS